MGVSARLNHSRSISHHTIALNISSNTVASTAASPVVENLHLSHYQVYGVYLILSVEKMRGNSTSLETRNTELQSLQIHIQSSTGGGLGLMELKRSSSSSSSANRLCAAGFTRLTLEL